MSYQMSLKEKVISYTKETGILPCIKLHHKDDYIAYAQAMYDGGARVIEVTMTTPGVLDGFFRFTMAPGIPPGSAGISQSAQIPQSVAA